MNLQEIVTKRTGKAISQCSNEELYFSLLEMTKGMAEEKVSNEGKRKLSIKLKVKLLKMYKIFFSK